MLLADEAYLKATLVKGYLDLLNLAGACLVVGLATHDAWAYGRHLRSILIADDGRHKVTTEGGTSHHEVAILTDLK